ncbi:MAG TPA: MSMEG_0565 family glycosyltransferase [Jiangellaceae bacterium]|jgi:glycosyltransferase-like protein|nr:MSMEG_0565 family glycosyltransferase [Jiangellaceae bacterium]
MTTSNRQSDRPRVALVSYSTKPRGGVVHTVSLAEAMVRIGMPTRVVSLGDPDRGFYRPVRAPYTLVPAPEHRAALEERVFASIDALEKGLAAIADEVDVFHTQDCISARAAARVRDAGADVTVVRTVHHIDDFTTAALIECQRRAVVEPDHLVVVSEDWRTRLQSEYGLSATVIHNGVDAGRFPPIGRARRDAVRRGLGLSGRFTFLAVGGIEPRKGSVVLFRAMAIVARQLHPAPALVVVGGHSFQDYSGYRDEALAMLPELGLELGRDVILAGTVSDTALHEYYRSADALAFPSVKEGWGLVVLEAMSADLPVVASDIPVLHEYLTDHETAVLTPTGDPQSLADGLLEVVADGALRERLIDGGRSLVPRFSWERAATEHRALYGEIWAMSSHSGPAVRTRHTRSGA